MDKRKIRDILRLMGSLVFGWLYIPHLLCAWGNRAVKSDILRNEHTIAFHMPYGLALLFFLHNNAFFRTLFYYRIGVVKALLIGWYRPGDKYFSISKTMKLGHSCQILHPYATVLNAESIGDNFSCLNCTTLGSTYRGKPVIGNNVSLGVSVTIIGNVHIGDNVTIGAGSVVVKDIPANCIVAGNPAKVIRKLD